MDRENEKELNRYLKNRQAYANAYKNAKVYTSSKAENMMNLSEIDPKKVKYKGVRGISQETGLEFEISQFEVELPNGEKTIVTTTIEGNSMSCDFIDENGKSQKFLLTPEEQNKIMKKVVNGKIQGNVETELLQEALFPNSQEDMEKEIEKDTLIPNNSEETVKKIKEAKPNADVKSISDNEKEKSEIDNNKEKIDIDSQNKELEKDKEDEEKINLPENIKDKISEIKEKEGASLKHLLITKNPKSVSDQLMETTGIEPTGEPVYCLSFKSGEVSTNDRIILVQGEKVIDERKNDEPGTSFMNQYRNSNVIENIEDNESKIYYTDIHGNTHISEMTSSPSDLNFKEKEELEKKLNEIDSKEEGIKSSDMPLENKIDLLNKVNGERLKTFDEYGINAENIRDEIEADIEIGEEVFDDITEEKENEDIINEQKDDDEGKTEQKNDTEKEDAEVEEDGYDPRDNRRYRN